MLSNLYSQAVTALATMLIVLLSGCQTGSGIGIAAGESRVNKSYETFSSQTSDMPQFLAPLMLANFNAAFASLGLNPTMADGELLINLRYVQDDIESGEKADDFEGHLAPGGNVRFFARIVIEMTDRETGELVWTGSVQRIHDVDAGEYMHVGDASGAILRAFQDVLEAYPVTP